MSDAWYYTDQNGRVGPMALGELTETLRTFSDPRSTYVWCSRFSDWKQVKDVPEVCEGLGTVQSPPLVNTEEGKRFCTKCGSKILGTANFCGNCGNPVSSISVNDAPRSADPLRGRTGCLGMFLLVLLGAFTFVFLKPVTAALDALDTWPWWKSMTVWIMSFAIAGVVIQAIARFMSPGAWEKTGEVLAVWLLGLIIMTTLLIFMGLLKQNGLI